jgi:iron complex outermembrane receptor protein
VQWFPTNDVALFATRATGFKSGGFNSRSTVRSALEVEREDGLSWEAGVKAAGFDRSLAFGVTLFDMEIENLQLPKLVGGTVKDDVITNAARARSRGAELDLRWLTPLEGLSITAAGAATDGRFLHYPDAPTSRNGTVDLSGHPLRFLPKWQLGVMPALELPIRVSSVPSSLARLGDRFAFTAAVDVLFRSKLDPNLDVADPREQGAYVLLDARVGVTTPDGAWALVLGGTNLTNADVIQLANPGGAFLESTSINQSFQRSWWMSLRYGF